MRRSPSGREATLAVVGRTGDQHRIVALSSSPRLDGNSRMLAAALVDGARAAGHAAHLIDLADWMVGMLGDCRRCRGSNGCCTIPDDFGELVHDWLVPADAIVYATPLYWYGMTATLKNFFDRLVCYISASYPRHQEVVDGLKQTRTALLLASEERYPTAAAAVELQLNEVCRYLHQPFVAVVNGIGNKRGEVRFDPGAPLEEARKLGQTIFELHHGDYHIDAVRPNAVWPAARAIGYDAEVTPFADV